MSKQIFVVNPTELDYVWEQTKPLIEKGLVHSQGELSIEQVRLLIVQGWFKLLISKDIKEGEIKAAAVVEFISFPNYRCANIVSLGGDKFGMVESDVLQLIATCKRLGATKIQGWTHHKMTEYLSKFGFQKKYDVVRMDI